MKMNCVKFVGVIFIASILIFICATESVAKKGDGGGPPGGEATGNCLSFPVIWSEGVAKVLRGESGEEPTLGGAWWYWWGTDANGNPLACAPDPDDQDLCDDNKSEASNGPQPGDGSIRAYLQQDSLNIWQAKSSSVESNQKVDIDWIDWADNLESQDWYTNSMVRTEVVLIKDLTSSMLQYEMKHLYGWGQTEMHGVATTKDSTGPPNFLANELESTQATVYSHCARLTIQKLLVPREDLGNEDLKWDTVNKEWTEKISGGTDLIKPPIFNKAVYESGDGPGYYSAEINVKGKIIYGYTWNLRTLNDPGSPAGDYRITFSLDLTCPTLTCNTNLNNANILITPEELAAEAEPLGGGTAYIDPISNLTYIDVRILERKGGKR